jgi:hypothetical protein
MTIGTVKVDEAQLKQNQLWVALGGSTDVSALATIGTSLVALEIREAHIEQAVVNMSM